MPDSEHMVFDIIENTQESDGANTLSELPIFLIEQSFVSYYSSPSTDSKAAVRDAVTVLRSAMDSLNRGNTDAALAQFSARFNAVSSDGAAAYINTVNQGRGRFDAVRAGYDAMGKAKFVNYLQTVITACDVHLTRNIRGLMGMIINNTPYEVSVSGWYDSYDEPNGCIYMRHGRMTDFMRAYKPGLSMMSDAQLLAVPQSTVGGANVGCFGGFYVIIKRDSSGYGAEGTMRLDVTDLRGGKYALKNCVQFMSACPYSNPNRVNLESNGSVPSKEIHDGLYKNGDKTRTLQTDYLNVFANVTYGDTVYARCVLNVR